MDFHLTQELVRDLFDYDETSGDLIWRRSKGAIKAGKQCRTLLNSGYYVVTVNYKSYLVHRIIWLWVYGYIPENDIDHIDRCKTNNTLCNLREISRQCNLINKGVSRNNTTGIVGVCFTSGKWQAQIKVRGNNHNLGSFDSFYEAICHRFAAEQCLGWDRADFFSSAAEAVHSMLNKKKLS